MIYKVWVCLEAEYDDIEADSDEEAFLIANTAEHDSRKTKAALKSRYCSRVCVF